MAISFLDALNRLLREPGNGSEAAPWKSATPLFNLSPRNG